MNQKKQLEYDSHHSAPQHHFCIPQPPQRTPFIPLHHAPQRTKHGAPRCTTQLHHTPQRTTIHPCLHHAPQRTNTTHPTAPRSGSPDPETPDAPGVLVLKAEAAAHCGYLAPMVQAKQYTICLLTNCISLSMLLELLYACD
jgi:hypothetical protein